jgi:hypothetical protein
MYWYCFRIVYYSSFRRFMYITARVILTLYN